MKMVLVIYSGAERQLVPDLFDRHHAGGYTELGGAHGAGVSGRREGTRAWPGDASIFFSIVPAERVEALGAGVREAAASLRPGERIHMAVLPTESFF